MSVLTEGPHTESFVLGKSVHFPELMKLARKHRHSYIYPSRDGFEVRIIREFCHGAEIAGRVYCRPTSQTRGFFWITISGSVTVWDLCQKIEEWTEDIPNDSIMVYCREGLIHFEYSPS